MSQARMKIAVIGAGISGMSAAWLLSQSHDVTLFETEGRPGGHSHTVDAPGDAPGEPDTPVDMGFIVYNEANYPNLKALFEHLGVATKPSDMSFGVSLGGGAMEYGGNDLGALFAQKRNLISPRFWSMLRDLLRFYRRPAEHVLASDDHSLSLNDYLAAGRYGQAFCQLHLLPQAAAIWSAPVEEIGDYPAAAFMRFFQNHGLLKIVDRPLWRTVEGGSRAYVQKLCAGVDVRLNAPVTTLRHLFEGGVEVRTWDGATQRFDQAVLACHADQALALLADPSDDEWETLSAFRYTANEAVLHTDERLMPRRKAVWSAWNYISAKTPGSSAHAVPEDADLCVTYWMNRLQGLGKTNYFVTLNPVFEPDPAKVIRREDFDHPLFNAAALTAQRRLWRLQGRRGVWFCGAYFGSGFHEDGLQSGLAVAEALGGVRRPWRVPDENGRIGMPAAFMARHGREAGEEKAA